jgi:cytidylate kinase
MGREKNRERLIICISGMAGSGKSTLAKRLATEYGLKCYSGGDALKALAIDEGYKAIERGWWESEEGMRFLERRSNDPKFDKAVDQKLLKLAREGNVILDSWTMPWLLEESFKIWLETSLEKRAERIAGRDNMGFEEALKALREKERRTKSIYKELYGFSLGDDFAPFKLILDTDALDAEEVFQVLCMIMDNIVLKTGSQEDAGRWL